MEEKKQPRVKILVACHKADPNIRQDDIYMPIQVGKALHPELDLGFQCDNTGDNISEKNGSYCELTALYWAWKNLKDVDYIGLCHYRRYFDFSNSDVRANVPLSKTPNRKKEKENLLKYISPKTKITSSPNFYPYSVAVDYAVGHYGGDLKIIYSIINEKFPDYKTAFEKAIFQSNSGSPYNMCILSWENFNEYCNFLFSLLAEAEKRISLTDYDSYQKRVFGFLAERIWNVFITYKKNQNIKIKYLPVVWATDTFRTMTKMHFLINKLRYKISFIITKSLNPIFKLS